MNEAEIEVLKAQRNNALDTVAKLAGMLSDKETQLEELRHEISQMKAKQEPPTV